MRSLASVPPESQIFLLDSTLPFQTEFTIEFPNCISHNLRLFHLYFSYLLY